MTQEEGPGGKNKTDAEDDLFLSDELAGEGNATAKRSG
jgi:hypothetical protein